MAFNATVVGECRADGDDLNGALFDASIAGGTDRSMQAAPHVTIDGATITAVVQATTTDLLVTGYTVATTDKGNCVYNSTGSGTIGRFIIANVNTGTNTWTLEKSAGTAGQTCIGRMGGAAKFPGSLTNQAGTTLVAGNKIWVKAGTYEITTATPGNGGPVQFGNVAIHVEGYNATRGDIGTPPLITAGAQTGVILFDTSAATNPFTLINVKVDGNSNSTVTGYTTGSRGLQYLCIAYRCTTGYTGSSGKTLNCLADTCGTGFVTPNAIGCVAKSCTGIGFNLTGSSNVVSDCIAYLCGGDGFSLSAGAQADNCSAYGNTGDGFDISAATSSSCTNCYSSSNTGYGFNSPATTSGLYSVRLVNCATYNNTAGSISNAVPMNLGFVTVTAAAFTDAAGGDFSLNNTAGGGALLRAAGLDPYGQTGYQDIGAVQHGDSTHAFAFIG